MLSDDVVKDGGRTKPGGETGSQLQLPEHTYTYLTADFLWQIAKRALKNRTTVL